VETPVLSPPVLKVHTAPVIETERLVLRGHTPEHFEDGLALWSDPEVTRFIGHWTALGYGFWAIEEKASGRFVGEAGFADFHRDITPSLTGMPEMGWALCPWAHRKGYATEAVRAAVQWGERHFDSAICCIISPGNSASIRVAEKAGFRELLTTAYHEEPTIIFRRDRPAG
jgi:RimJ/RimL family protein N-acetyltransferase